jgi:glycosyltransferase involved in cell wall biosynthesis
MVQESQAELELSIVVPCLNEAATIAGCIERARRYIESRGIHGEIVVADNGSADGSADVAMAHGARVVRVAERGYGSALLGGIEAAGGRLVIMGDADGSYDFLALDPFVEKLREGYDLVVGNRFLGGIAPGAMPPLHRYFGNPGLSGVGRLFFRAPVRDFHCGLRGLRRDLVERLKLRTTGMEFASEMIVKAVLNGCRVTEVPTTLSQARRAGRPHLRSWRDGWRHLRFLLLFSPSWLFLYPGICLFVLGFVVMAMLLVRPRSVGDVVFDVNTLVYSAAAISCGFQAMSFWLFAKLSSISAGLLPADPPLQRLAGIVTLEVGALLGLALVLSGLVASGCAVRAWSLASFGPLDPRESLRLVVPAATVLVLGVQITFASFFASVLGLKTR